MAKKEQIMSILLDYMQEFLDNHKKMSDAPKEDQRKASFEITEKTANKIMCLNKT